MSNRFSRIVIPIYAPSYNGVYYGRWANGDKPASGAVLAADHAARVAAAGQLTSGIRLGAAAGSAAGGAAGLSTAIRLAAAAGVVALGSAVFAATGFDFYFSPTGTGSASTGGTQSDPWPITMLTNSTAISRYTGKKLGLLDGTYDLIAIMGQPGAGGDQGNRLTVAGGSAGSPTILQAVNPLAAIIDGGRPSLTSGTDSQAGIIGPSGDYVTFDGFVVQGAHYRSINNYAGGGNNFVVQNCWIKDQFYIYLTGTAGRNSAMIFMQGKSNCVIRNCRFELAGSPADGNRHANIQFYDSTDCTVEYCTIIGNSATGNPGASGNCIHFKNGLNHRMTVRYCYIDRSASGNSTSRDCIPWDCGSAATDGSETCHHNIVINGSGACILGAATNTWNIYKNTFIGNPQYAEAALDRLDSGSPIQVNIHRNIFNRTSIGGRGDICIGGTGVLGTMDFNLYDSNPSMKIQIYGGTAYTSIATWRTASGKDANSTTTTDPLFAGTGTEADLYALQSSSLGKTLDGGAEVGAWADGIRPGCNF